MKESNELVWLETTWFTPRFQEEGLPILTLYGDPQQRTLLCVFSTREKCTAGVQRWFAGAKVAAIPNPLAMHDEATRKGYTVALDLEDDGETWHFATFNRPVFSPGGSA